MKLDADVLTVGSRGYELTESVIIWQFSSAIPSHVVAVVQQMDLWLQFVSDVSGTRGGFQLAIERINDSGTFAPYNIPEVYMSRAKWKRKRIRNTSGFVFCFCYLATVD